VMNTKKMKVIEKQGNFNVFNALNVLGIIINQKERSL
jgi:hypothetical protein